jgi:hypothetical protein
LRRRRRATGLGAMNGLALNPMAIPPPHAMCPPMWGGMAGACFAPFPMAPPYPHPATFMMPPAHIFPGPHEFSHMGQMGMHALPHPMEDEAPQRPAKKRKSKGVQKSQATTFLMPVRTKERKTQVTDVFLQNQPKNRKNQLGKPAQKPLPPVLQPKPSALDEKVCAHA